MHRLRRALTNSAAIHVAKTAVTPVADYEIHNDADWTTVNALSTATLDGKTIMFMRGAELSPIHIEDRDFSLETKFIAESGGESGVDQPLVTATVAAGVDAVQITNSHNVTLQGLDILQESLSFGGIVIRENCSTLNTSYNNVRGVPFDPTDTPPALGANNVGIYAPGGSSNYVDGWINSYNTVSYFNIGCFAAVGGAKYTALRNFYDIIRVDHHQIASIHANQCDITVAGEVYARPCALSGDSGSPHPDLYQVLFDFIGGADFTKRYEYYGNIGYHGVARGSAQGAFVTDPADPGSVKDAFIFGNIMLSNNEGAATGLKLSNAQHSFSGKNVSARPDPGTGDAGWGIDFGSGGRGDNFSWKDKAEAFTSTTGVTAVDRVVLSNSEVSYTAAGLVGPYGLSTLADRDTIIAQYGDDITEINWETMELNRDALPSGVPSVTIVDAPLADYAETGWFKIKEGPALQSLVLDAGVEYAISASEDGSSPSAWSGTDSTTIPRGSFINLRAEASADPSDTLEFSNTLNGFPVDLSITTVAATPYARTSWPINTTLTHTNGIGGADAQYFAFKWKGNPSTIPVATLYVLRQASGSRFVVRWDNFGNRFRIIANNSAGATVFDFYFTPPDVTSDIDLDICILGDLTEATSATGIQATVNGVAQTLTVVDFDTTESIDFNQNVNWEYMGQGAGDLAFEHLVCFLKIGGTKMTMSELQNLSSSNDTSYTPQILLKGDAATIAAGNANSDGTATGSWVLSGGPPVDA